MAAVACPLTLASLQCRDETRRVFTDQVDIANTHAPSAKRREAFGESHDGRVSFYREPLVRRTRITISAPAGLLLSRGGHFQNENTGPI